MFTFQAIQILIFLVPGFIAARILNSLVVRKQDFKELESIIEASVFSMLIYTISSLFRISSFISLDPNNYSISFPKPWSFVLLIVISIFLAFALAYSLRFDLFMKFARFIQLTKKTSRLTVWNDAFDTKKPYVIINFVDGRKLYGWVEHFSDYPDKPYIYLCQPKLINEKDEFIDIGIEGMLITPEQKIGFIQFLKLEEPQELGEGKKWHQKKNQKVPIRPLRMNL